MPEDLLDRIAKEQDRLRESMAQQGISNREALEAQVAQRVTCEYVIEQLIKADNGVFALLVVEAQGLRKRKDERDTEFVKRIVKNYNGLVVGQLARDLLGWTT